MTVEAAKDAFAGDVAVTVITAVPGATPVTVTWPLDGVTATTVATAGLFVPNVMTAAAAPVGCCAEPTSGAVEPTAIDSDDGCTVKPVDGRRSRRHVDRHASRQRRRVKPVPEPVAVTVMVAVPGATAVTTPASRNRRDRRVLDAYAYVISDRSRRLRARSA